MSNFFAWLSGLFNKQQGGQVVSSRKKPAAVVGISAAMALAISFVGGWEGVRTTAYLDRIASPPVWTVCYGETRGVKQGDTYTMEQCGEMLQARLLEFERGLDNCLTREEEIPTKTKIAFVSWSYNVGLGAACKSTLVRRANEGNFLAACEQLPRWNRAGGKIIRGLTNRRVSERKLCLEGLGK